MVRRKYRWIFIEIISEKIPDRTHLENTLRRKSLELFGTLRAPQFKLVRYNQEKGVGIIRCLREDLNKVRLILAFTRTIDNSKIVINDALVSGTFKKLRDKIKLKI